MLVFVKMQIAFGLLVFFAQHSVGGGEFGHDESASAQIANKAAEDRVSYASHRGEDSSGGDLHIADQQRWCDARLARFCGFRTGEDARASIAGIVPELAHEHILMPVARFAPAEVRGLIWTEAFAYAHCSCGVNSITESAEDSTAPSVVMRLALRISWAMRVRASLRSAPSAYMTELAASMNRSASSCLSK